MKYTKREKLYEIGEKIFPTDFSSFHRKDGEYCSEGEEIDARMKLRNGKPFVVLSEPYEKCDIGLFEHEYYIDVKFQDDDTIYCTFNSKVNVFKKYWDMLEFIWDCETCAAFGY